MPVRLEGMLRWTSATSDSPPTLACSKIRKRSGSGGQHLLLLLQPRVPVLRHPDSSVTRRHARFTARTFYLWQKYIFRSQLVQNGTGSRRVNSRALFWSSLFGLASERWSLSPVLSIVLNTGQDWRLRVMGSLQKNTVVLGNIT